ncbi:hypothetical protein QDA02_gp95 [Microbacterium phage Margaery]|uniref:Uncharacterized protein n=1 Tax=Microbacterium phage Margaery TaxID=2591217 RepID=A0A514DHI1_9CAUD|nr:hypothetical protein QDA02_gp95 [Microbacterium phage Margaery]QDH93070.1 hypothetical protein PBI_MARGAERY_13 [Microbacterium phage Margaery]
MTGIPSVCPCCGAYSLAPDAETVTLVAVCDVLVVKALERVGAFLIRGERSRYQASRGKAVHTVHTMWQAEDEITERALRGAWDVVPAVLDAHGCCGVTSLQVTAMLDDYVHDLVLTGTEHALPELEYRFRSRLGMPVGEHEHAEATNG